MYLFLTTKSEQVSGPDVVIDCPNCGDRETLASSYELRERLCILFVIPVLFLRNTFVHCRTCNTRLTSGLTIGELEQHSSGNVSLFLSNPVPFIAKVIAIVALLVVWAPLVGLVMAILAMAVTRGRSGWPRVVAVIAFVLSGLLNFALLVLFLVALVNPAAVN
jgi:hypothetical protein